MLFMSNMLFMNNMMFMKALNWKVVSLALAS